MESLCIQVSENLEATLRTAILLLLHVNWQLETNYYPTHVRLPLAGKLFQIDRYIFLLIL